jgi:hypothetical protein
VALSETCKHGHTGARYRNGKCGECQRVNAVLWLDAPQQPEDRRLAWEKFCAGLDDAIAEIRRTEGFDSRVTPWQTFDPPIPSLVAPKALRAYTRLERAS